MCCAVLIKKWSPLLQSRLRGAAATHKGGSCDLSRGAAVPPPLRAFLVSRRWQCRLSTTPSQGVSFQFSRVKFFACSLPRKNERYLSSRFFSLFHLRHCWYYSGAPWGRRRAARSTFVLFTTGEMQPVTRRGGEIYILKGTQDIWYMSLMFSVGIYEYSGAGWCVKILQLLIKSILYLKILRSCDVCTIKNCFMPFKKYFWV